MPVMAVLYLIVLPLAQVAMPQHVGFLTEGLDNPARIAVATSGILVTDPRANAIVRYDSTGAYVGTWSEPAGPLGIAVHADGRIFVSRRDDAKVAVYDSSFVFQHFLTEGRVSFTKPTDLAFDPTQGRILVLDSGADRLYAFDDSESTVLILGVRGGGFGQFKYPSAIALDSTNGRILVADQENFRVQVFDRSGIYQFSFGYRIKYLPGGGQEGWFARTAGLAVATNGNIYVTDAMMGTLRMFSAAGTELAKVAGYGIAAGELQNPCGVAIDATGRILVANSNAGKVEIFAASAQASTANVAVNTDPAGLSINGDVQTSTPGYDAPHMLDDLTCNHCHNINSQPGGHLGTAVGQANLCISCHTGGGQGASSSFRTSDAADPYGTNPAVADGKGRSHAWNVPAVNAAADSVGPVTGGQMGRYLENGNIKCATCHNQHTESAGAPYLRASNSGDAMCKECHAARNKGPGQGGTHPVGFAYPGGTGEFPAVSGSVPVLKNGKVECSTCHATHAADSGGVNNGAGDGMLLRAANDGTLCRICHADHQNHATSGSWQPACPDCHDAHDLSSVNLSLVTKSIHNQTLGQNKPVAFTARSGAGSFSDGDPAANDGICQVCHTATGYHRHDGSGASHNDGTQCTSCHPHSTGFKPVGGDCISCHSRAQDNGDGIPVGGRRAVVTEFPNSAHAHYGATLGGAACEVCHSMTTHKDGYVDLVDPDDDSLYRFRNTADLTSDPDLSTFCAHCHDADGAKRLPNPMDPFGGGNTPPDVATRFKGTLQWLEWYGDFCFGTEGTQRAVNSHHDISNGDQAFSGAKLECLNCHGAHTAADTQPLADPFNTHAPWTGGDNEFCLSCHAGGAGSSNPGFPLGVVGPAIAMRGIDSCGYDTAPWYVDYTWTHSAHGPSTKRTWPGYSGAPAYELRCKECHDPHGSYSPANTAGNPYMIRDQVDGRNYLDDGFRNTSFTGPPWTKYGTQRDVKVAVNGTSVGWGGNQGLCAVCHPHWLATYQQDWWHSGCDGCQTCHGHGQSWGEYDWSYAGNDRPCPLPAAATGLQGVSKLMSGFSQESTGSKLGTSSEPPLHRREVR